VFHRLRAFLFIISRASQGFNMSERISLHAPEA